MCGDVKQPHNTQAIFRTQFRIYMQLSSHQTTTSPFKTGIDFILHHFLVQQSCYHACLRLIEASSTRAERTIDDATFMPASVPLSVSKDYMSVRQRIGTNAVYEFGYLRTDLLPSPSGHPTKTRYGAVSEVRHLTYM